MSLNGVNIKEEKVEYDEIEKECCNSDRDPLEPVPVKLEKSFVEIETKVEYDLVIESSATVKEDTEDEDEECSMAAHGLYIDYAVKSELDLGPEQMLAPKVTYALRNGQEDKVVKSDYSSEGVIVKHKGKFSIICCNKTYTPEAHLRHLKIHHPIHLGCTQCRFCRNGKSPKVCLNKYSPVHTGTKNYICKICNEVIKKKKDFKEHYRKHAGMRPYSCKVCDFMYASMKGLNRHKRKHTVKRNISCDHCKWVFSTQMALEKHQRSPCTEDKSYACGICYNVFPRQSALSCHVRLMHGTEM